MRISSILNPATLAPEEDVSNLRLIQQPYPVSIPAVAAIAGVTEVRTSIRFSKECILVVLATDNDAAFLCGAILRSMPRC